jgi:hypothetical protein
MFAIPIAGLSQLPARPPAWVRAAAASGFLMTLLYVTLSVLPIVTVNSRLTFAAKICGVIALTNAVGFAIYHRLNFSISARRQRHS